MGTTAAIFSFLLCVVEVSSFTASGVNNKVLLLDQHPARHPRRHFHTHGLQVSSTKQEDDETAREKRQTEADGAEYKNAATSVLSNFMQKEGEGTESLNPILSAIDFGATKSKKLPIETLASVLDYELYTKEWFVTGNVNPIYFSDDFEFQDPDVKLSGIEEYAKGVNKLFDQGTSRAEIISTVVKGKDTITVTWRLSGKVNIGPGGGLTIKPYIVYTDFIIDQDSGLVVFQVS